MKVFGFAGYSGSGKTTLIERVLPKLIAHGLRVSVIKHTHHDFDLDRPGKDSYRHRVAGRGRSFAGVRPALCGAARIARRTAADAGSAACASGALQSGIGRGLQARAYPQA